MESEYGECGAPLAFSPDGVHCVGCRERQAPSGDVALALLFVPLVNVDGAMCDAFCCLKVADWTFTPGGCADLRVVLSTVL
jgi:hypothetical protein